MPISFNKKLGKNDKKYSLYTKEEIDFLLSKSRRLTERGSSTGGGGGSSGNSWDTLTGKPFKTVNTSTGQFVISSDELNLPQDLATVSDVEFNSIDISGSSFVDTSRNVSAREGSFTQAVTMDDTLTINSQLLFDLNKEQNLSNDADVNFQDVSELNYIDGWLAAGGRGYGITQDPNATQQWNAQFNDLLVRGTLKVFEFIVKQIAVLGGTEILSVAVAEADSVSGSAGSETVTITDPRSFGGTSLAVDDLVIVQRVDINDTTIVKQEFRTVSSITGTDVTFTSTSGAPTPSDAIEDGDIVVAYGNLTDADRQNIIYRNVDASGGSVIDRVQENIDSYTDFNDPLSTTRVAKGDLNGFADYTSQVWGFFAGDNNTDKVTIDATNGIRFLDSTNTVAAQLSGDLFRIGDANNYVQYDASTQEIDIDVQKFLLDAISSNKGIKIDSSVPSFTMSAEFSSLEKEVLAIGPDETAPTPHEYNSGSFTNVTISSPNIGDTTSFETGIETDASVVIEFDIDTTNTTNSNVSQIYANIVGKNSVSGDQDYIASLKVYDEDENLIIPVGTQFLVGNTKDFDEIAVNFQVYNNSGGSYGSITFENISYKVSNSTIAINDKGLFVNLSDTYSVSLTGLISGGIVSAGANWGNIEGTLSNQTDLQNALDGKADTTHTHTESDITDLDHYTDADLEAYIVGTGSFQTLGTGDNVQFNDLELTGTINYVNETNLQVEDKTITLNKGGTDASSEGAGIIIERVGTDQSILWNSTDGFDFSDGIAIGGTEFVDSARNVSARTLSTSGASAGGYGIETTSGGAIFKRNSFVFFDLQVPASGSSTDRFRFNYDGSVVRLTQLDTDSGLEIRLEGDTRVFGSDLTVEGNTTLNNTLTINSQLLFTLGNEQLLSTDASPTFGGGTFTGELFLNVGAGTNAIRFQNTAGMEFQGQYGNLYFQTDGGGGQRWIIRKADATNLFSVYNDGTIEIDLGELLANNATFSDDVDVNGLLTAETIQTQTLRTTLFKPNTIIGMGGKSIWNATSTVVSVDTGANTIVAEDAVFANGDKVVVSSAVYNQSGFSNVELNITSNGSAVSGGTQYSYTVNSGSESDIGNGDTIVKVDGDLIFVDAEDGTDKPSIAGYSNLSGFADSPASGGSAEPAWLLTPNKFFYEGITSIIYAPELVADGSDDDAVSDLIITDWVSTVTSPAGSTQTFGSNNTKIYRRVEHRYGLETLRIQGRCSVDDRGSGGGTQTARVTVNYGSASTEFDVITATGGSANFDETLDISGETGGELVDFEVRLQCIVQGANSSTVREAVMDGRLTAIAYAG